MSEPVVVEVVNAIATVTLNRPEALNTFTGAMGQQLSDAYRALDADDGVRVIVLTGAGRAFCAGADMASGTSFSAEAAQASSFRSSPVRPAAFELRTPVIAAINGHAIGIGMTLAMQCDLRVMATTAKWGVVQNRRGVVPDAHSHWTVPRVAGFANAAEILLLGRTYTGAQALALGVVNEVCDAAHVLARATEIAEELRDHVAPVSAALSKRILWQSLHSTPERIDELELSAHQATMGAPDSREGPAAFFERRVPRWTGSVDEQWPPGFGQAPG